MGLCLRNEDADRVGYFMRDYRHLIIPEQITKGKPYLVLSLYRQGKTEEEITEITQTKKSAVRSYITLYESNTHPIEFFLGQTLTTSTSCEAMAAILKGN